MFPGEHNGQRDHAQRRDLTGHPSYSSQLASYFPKLPVGVREWGFTSIYESVDTASTASPLPVSHDGTATKPLWTTGCASGSGDWGIQEIQVTVFYGTLSLSRDRLEDLRLVLRRKPSGGSCTDGHTDRGMLTMHGTPRQSRHLAGYQRGFTLIEIVVSLALMTIIAGAVGIAFTIGFKAIEPGGVQARLAGADDLEVMEQLLGQPTEREQPASALMALSMARPARPAPGSTGYRQGFGMLHRYPLLRLARTRDCQARLCRLDVSVGRLLGKDSDPK